MKRLAVLVCLSSLAVLPGCLINSSNSTSISGRYIGPQTLAQVEPGKSRQDFVVATLGTPTTKTVLEDGSEVWKYEYRKRTQSSGKVFLLLDSDSFTEKDGAVYVIFRDGVVEKTWRDA